MESNANSTRDLRIDQLKAFLVFFVVYAHVVLLAGFFGNGHNPCKADLGTTIVNRILWTFLMPTFIFISGYFTRRRSINKTIEKNRGIIKVFLVFHIINCLLKLIVNHTLSFSEIISPSFALWYLVVLFYWRMFISILEDHGHEKKYLAFFLLLSLLVGFIPIKSEFAFQRTFSLFPFFYAGYLCRKNNFTIPTTNKRYLLSLTIFLLCCGLATLDKDRSNYMLVPYQDTSRLLLRIAGFIVSFTQIYCIRILVSKVPVSSFLAKLGNSSLFFYVYHPYILLPLVLLYSTFISHYSNIISSLVIATLTMTILYAMKKIPSLSKILH